MTTQIDGKQIANMLYHAGVETLLTVGYAELGRKLLKRPPPKVDFNMADIGMLSIDIHSHKLLSGHLAIPKF